MCDVTFSSVVSHCTVLLGAAILCTVLRCDVMLNSVVSHCTVLLGAAILCTVLCVTSRHVEL